MGKLSDALAKALPGKEFTADVLITKAGPAVEPPSANRQERQNLEAFATSGWDERLLLTSAQYSPFAEHFRRLRSAVLHPRAGSRPKTIMITSLVPGEGKGFVCANLGVSLAREMEHHALLVDCDFRRPALAPMFGLAGDVGLVDHLRDGIDLESLIRPTGQPKLSLLASGTPPENPSELLASKRLIPFIDELARRYDDRIILFDSPPGIVASETSIMAKRVDGVILVVRWGKADKDQVKKFVDEIGPDKILGTVFNACEKPALKSLLPKKQGYEGYYSHNY